MSASSKPRIVRKHKPKRKFTEATKRKALPFLLKDFQDRCAYSLMHVQAIGETCMEVDHHNPELKHAARQKYANLFPAHRLCNNAKKDQWPSKAMQERGVRLLNPCEETDYGEQIFEDPVTHHLVGSNAAASYHIIVMDLNNSAFVTERRRRSQFAQMMSGILEAKPGEEFAALQIIGAYKQTKEMFIPPIPAPPSKAA